MGPGVLLTGAAALLSRTLLPRLCVSADGPHVSPGETGVVPQCGKQWSEAAGLLCELLALLPAPRAQASAADSMLAATCSGSGSGGGCEAPRHLQPRTGFSSVVFRAWRQLLQLVEEQPAAADGDAAEPPASKRRRVDVSSGGDAKHSNSAACSAAHIAVLQSAGAEAGLPAPGPEEDANSVTGSQKAQEGTTGAGLAAAQPPQPAAAALTAAAAQCMAMAVRHLKVCSGLAWDPGCATARTCRQHEQCIVKHVHCRACVWNVGLGTRGCPLPLQVAFGESHPATETNAFLPFAAGLPFGLAALVVQQASKLQQH